MTRSYARDDYTRCIAALVAALPDVRLTVAEHAQSGEFVFIRRSCAPKASVARSS